MRVSIEKGNNPDYHNKLVSIHVSFLTTITSFMINEIYMAQMFAPFGKLVDCVVKQHALTIDPPKQCGYGFLYFSDMESAHNVMQALAADPTLNGVKYDCKLSNAPPVDSSRKEHHIRQAKQQQQQLQLQQQYASQLPHSMKANGMGPSMDMPKMYGQLPPSVPMGLMGMGMPPSAPLPDSYRQFRPSPASALGFPPSQHNSHHLPPANSFSRTGPSSGLGGYLGPHGLDSFGGSSDMSSPPQSGISNSPSTMGMSMTNSPIFMSNAQPFPSSSGLYALSGGSHSLGYAQSAPFYAQAQPAFGNNPSSAQSQPPGVMDMYATQQAANLLRNSFATYPPR